MIDLTEGQLDKELAFAKELGTDSLQKCIDRLKMVDENNGCETKIVLDYAPHSFYFERTDKSSGKMIRNGGVIFHDISNGVGTHGPPSFSVSIGDDKEPHWETHT